MSVRRTVRVSAGVHRYDADGTAHVTLLSPTLEGARRDYRDYVRAMKAQRRDDARQSAQVEHAHNEERLRALGAIFTERVREPFDWHRAVSPRPRPTLPPFVAPEDGRTENDARAEVKASTSMKAYVIVGVVALLVALGTRAAWLRPPMLFTALLAGLAVRDVQRRRRALTSLTMNRYRAEHRQRVSAAKLQYQRDAEERDNEWQQREASRAALRTAVERSELAPLAELLQEELDNEELPLPVSFDIEFCSADVVKLEVALPTIEVVPEQRSQLTKTGKIAYRNMAKRDRLALYRNLCCGLSLRLAHETFRVLPMVQRVDVTGFGDDAAGEQVRALQHSATRDMFADDPGPSVEASAYFERLGGEFSCAKNGVLSELPAA